MSNVSVPVIADNVLEKQEEFNLMLHVPSSLGPLITSHGRVSAVGIINDSNSK